MYANVYNGVLYRFIQLKYSKKFKCSSVGNWLNTWWGFHMIRYSALLKTMRSFCMYYWTSVEYCQCKFLTNSNKVRTNVNICVKIKSVGEGYKYVCVGVYAFPCISI